MFLKEDKQIKGCIEKNKTARAGRLVFCKIIVNVKSEHISQLDVHYHSYLDTITEVNTTENVKPILIINHQKNKALSEREKVHEIQCELAVRNGSLIVETSVLLCMSEKYKNNEISVEGCIGLFISKLDY